MAKLCAFCGTEATDDALFCGKCGNKFEEKILKTEIKDENCEKAVINENKEILIVKETSINNGEIVEKEKQEYLISNHKEPKIETIGELKKKEGNKTKDKTKVIIGIMVAIILGLIIFIVSILTTAEKDYVEKPSETENSQYEDLQSEEVEQKDLPKLDEFESLISAAIIDFYKDADIDAEEEGYLLKNYECNYMRENGAVYDYMISADYGPSSNIILMGRATDGYVDYVYTFMPLIGVEITTEQLVTIYPTLMIPVLLFNDDYDGYVELFDLMEYIVDNGTHSDDGNQSAVIIDDIKYTLTISDSLIGFTVEKISTEKLNAEGNEEVAHVHIWKEDYNESDEDVHYKECECGERKYENHNYDDGIITKDATHMSEGEKIYTCVDCGRTKIESLPKDTNHNFGNWQYYDDNDHIKYCSCGESRTEKHNWIFNSYQSNGSVTVYYCVCGAEVKEETMEIPTPNPEEEKTTYCYYHYYAEYYLEGYSECWYYGPTVNSVVNGIKSVGGTIIGEVQYYEITLTEYVGELYEDANGIYLYYLK